MIIIHGEDITKSRAKLDEILSSKETVKRFDGKKLREADVPLLFSATELFDQGSTIVIENCKGMTKPVLEAVLASYLKSDNELVFWQIGNYDTRLIKKFKDAQVFAFPLPKYYFMFLDTLAPHKGMQLHKIYHQLLESYVAEQIYFSMVKRIRQLLIVQSGEAHEFEEYAKMSVWQRNKIEAQARQWNSEALSNFYAKLYDTEIRIKTSSLPTNLATHLDILLLSELH